MGLCFDIASTRVHLEFLHVTTSIYPFVQSVVLLLSALALFGRLTAAYSSAFKRTRGTFRTNFRGGDGTSAAAAATPTYAASVVHQPSTPAPGGGSDALAAAEVPLLQAATQPYGSTTSSPTAVSIGGMKTPVSTSSTSSNPFRRPSRRRKRPAKSLNDLHRMVLPAYYTLSQLLCLFFFVQIIVYLPDSTSAVTVLRYSSFVLSATFDNFTVAFMFTKRARVAATVAFCVACMYTVYGAVAIPLAPCQSWCHYYASQIPSTSIAFPYLAFGVVYIFLAVWAHLGIDLPCRCVPRPRPALRNFAAMLAVSYIFGGGGVLILSQSLTNAAFCFVDLGVLFYTLTYVPVLYTTMLADTRYCNQQRYMSVLAGMRDGDNGASLKPTVDNLQQLLADPSVNVIPYEDVEVVATLGSGASGQVYSGTWRGAPVAIKQLGESLLGVADWRRDRDRTRIRSVALQSGPLAQHTRRKGGAVAAGAGPDSDDARGQKRVLRMLGHLVQEAAILSSLRHPNIVTLYGIVVDARHHALITEVVPGVNLFTLLHPNRTEQPTSVQSKPTGAAAPAAATPEAQGTESFLALSRRGSSRSPASHPSWHTKLSYLTQVAAGLSFLHRASVLHRDLKSGNVLIRSDDGVVKVCDFGLSVHRTGTIAGGGMDAAAAPAPALGTCQWTAPEVLREQPHSIAADVWSFGVIMWECCSYLPPFAGMSAMRVATQVAFRDLRLPRPPSAPVARLAAASPPPPTDDLLPCPAPLLDIMDECLREDPTRRPSFAQLTPRLRAVWEALRRPS